MLGDDSTHSMNMIPNAFHERVFHWKRHIDGIRALDEAQFSSAQKWAKCLAASYFFLEFSPEFHGLLRGSRDANGCFTTEVVDLIMGVHGKCFRFFAFV